MMWMMIALLGTASAEEDAGGNGDWNKKPYWNPVVGGYAFNYNGSTLYGLNLGAEVGLRYKQVDGSDPCAWCLHPWNKRQRI
jgi:hypothetical protein